ncbi:hypothetical protein [Chitinophaga pinensis]|uniref:YD repeat-containing protein n=1 Tax=Chitinophaga pinensis (strain ATCC 43595 / DSM 2588 / LMG 13176 / NBRC 15968 / NCIMB 11800 / UQM 2034) TaxID=485918 RepID=A0A979G4P5_CHIPD|nr:hypothetical protein [Chitinophaga pinensis]ACU60653.1 hypothetical protein Cpin_3186 [Chitinophaga pinensis DSM 2588]
MKWFSLSLALLVAPVVACFAQSNSPNPAVIPKSFSAGPNEASLDKFTEYEVDFSKGLAEVGIPLHTIKMDDGEIPIAFGYHGAGIKVTEVPGYLGAGWSLSVGGSLTRSIMGGRADEASTGYMRDTVRTAINKLVDADLYYLNQVATGEVDAQPDVFSVNVPGAAVKFVMPWNNGYKPVTIPRSAVAVDKSFDPVSGKLFFTVTTPAGVRYIFGENYREVTTSNNGGVESMATSAWKLEKVISANSRDTVFFKYHAQSSIAIQDVNEVWGIDDSRTLVSPDNDVPSGSIYPNNSQVFLNASSYSSSTLEYLIDTIAYKNRRLVFEEAAQGRKDFGSTWPSKPFKSMKVYALNYATGAYELTETVEGYLSYFMTGTDTLTRRLRLDSVRFLDANSVVVKMYKMQYDNQGLPRRDSKARDLLGYFNGKNNSTLIPRMTLNYITGVGGTGSPITIGSDIANGRDPDSVKSQACVLKRLYLPTGGYNEYEYEQNRYLEDDSIILAGGLRIKNIKGYDPLGNTRLTRFYKYGEGENGAGKKNFVLQDFNFVTAQTHNYWHSFSGGIMLMLTKRRRTVGASPNVDLVPWDAAPVIYSTVTEYRDSLGLGGKTVMRYTDQTDVTSTASYAKPFRNSYFYRRGQLASKEVYRRTGSAYVLKSSQQYNYQAFSDTLYQFAGLVAIRNSVNEGELNGGVILPSSATNPSDEMYIQHSWYAINSGDNAVTSVVTREYDDNDPSRFFTTVTKYEYDNVRHLKPNRTTTLNSNGDSSLVAFKFPADYVTTGSTTGNGVLDGMLSRNMQSFPIEVTEYKITKGSTARKCYGSVLNLYKSVNNGKDLVPDVIKRLALDSPVVNFTPSSIAAGSIQFDSRYKNVESFPVYSATGKVAQHAPKTDPPTVFMFDYSDESLVAVVQNAAPSEVAYTSFETPVKGNFSFSGATTVDASAPTGKKAYNLSGGGITFPALVSSKTYTVSYWTKNTVPYSIAGTVSGYPVKGKSYGSWTYYEHRIQGVTGATLTGAGWIDELRLYPSAGRMVTCAYTPFGAVAAKADEAGNLMFYEYDAMSRLKTVREFEHIVKTVDYNYKK